MLPSSVAWDGSETQSKQPKAAAKAARRACRDIGTSLENAAALNNFHSVNIRAGCTAASDGTRDATVERRLRAAQMSISCEVLPRGGASSAKRRRQIAAQ